MSFERMSPWTPAGKVCGHVADLRISQPMTPCTPWTPAWSLVDTPIPTPLIHEAEAANFVANAAPVHFNLWPTASTSFADENAPDSDGTRACVTALPSIAGLTPLNLQALASESEQDGVLRMRMNPQSCGTTYTYSTDSIASHRTPCCSPDKIRVGTPSSAGKTAVHPASGSLVIQGASFNTSPQMVKEASCSSFGSESIDTGRANLDESPDIGAPPQRPVRRASVPIQPAVRSSFCVERRNSSPAAGSRVAALSKLFENKNQACTIKTLR